MKEVEEGDWSGRMVGFCTRTVPQCTVCYQSDSLWQKKKFLYLILPITHHISLHAVFSSFMKGTIFQSIEDIRKLGSC
jgi:hypothetical protein